MSDFVKLAGKLPGTNESGYFFLNRNSIKAIYPLWGVKSKETGTYQSCSRKHPGAELPFCQVVDMAGTMYYLYRVDCAEKWGHFGAQKRTTLPTTFFRRKRPSPVAEGVCGEKMFSDQRATVTGDSAKVAPFQNAADTLLEYLAEHHPNRLDLSFFIAVKVVIGWAARGVWGKSMALSEDELLTVRQIIDRFGLGPFVET
jgi:hypothetical protein